MNEFGEDSHLSPRSSKPSAAQRLLLFTHWWLLRPIEWLACAALLAATAGVAVYAAYFERPGPVYIRSTAMPLWWTLLFAFFSAQLLLRVREQSLPACACNHGTRYWCLTAFYGASLVLVLLSFFALAIGRDADSAAWCFVTALALLLTLLVLRTRLTDERSRVPEAFTQPSRWRARWAVALLYCNAVLHWLVVIFLALLFNGAQIRARGYVSYAPRGTFSSVTYPDSGRTLAILWDCQGPPATAARPTVFLEADGSHGIADFWPLQRDLVASGRRVCIFDKPGNGWSEDFFADQGTPPSIDPIYDQILSNTGEKAPYMLVGWAGGSPLIYAYALRFPERVASLVFLDTAGDEFEWRQAQAQNSWSSDVAVAYRREQLASRYTLFGIIRGLGCPWGLMSIFLSPDTTGYAWPERWDEYRWFYLTAKTWTTQLYWLRAQEDAVAAEPIIPYNLGLFNRTVPALLGKPILSVITRKAPAALCPEIDVNSPTCKQRIINQEFFVQDARAVGNATGNAMYTYCNLTKCDLGFALRLPQVVVNAINRYFP